MRREQSSCLGKDEPPVGPQDANGPCRFRLFLFVMFVSSANIEIVDNACGKGERGRLAELRQSSSMLSDGQMPFCFSLYRELFRVPGIGESQFQAYPPSLVFRGVSGVARKP